jgi:RimJ/RimL family protein N-acetyltransferase
MIELKAVYSNEQIEEVARLACEIWNEHFPVIIGQAQVDYMVEKFQSANALVEQINNGYQYFLIRSNHKLVGYIGLNSDVSLHQVQLSKFYIIKTMRGKGIGREVLYQIVDSQRKLGVDKIWLTVNKNNIMAINAYDRMGFASVDSVVQDIGNGYVMDDFRMEKTVT